VAAQVKARGQATRIPHALFVEISVGGQPDAGCHLLSPTFEVEVEAYTGNSAGIEVFAESSEAFWKKAPRDANDAKAGLIHPNVSRETAAALGIERKNRPPEAISVGEPISPVISKRVVVFMELPQIDE